MKVLKSIIVIIILYAISYQVCAQSSVTDYNSQIPKKLTFQIEVVLNSSEILPKNVIEMFSSYAMKKTPTQNIYLLGEFPNEKRTELYQKSLSNFGYTETNVVAYFRQRRISMQDALTLANNYNRYDDESYVDNSSIQHSSMTQGETFATNIHYSLELNRHYPLDKIAEIENAGFKVVMVPSGNFKIEMGYKSYDDIIADKQLLTDKGIEGLILLTHSDNRQIAL
ncbi:MAG: hypothetical protein JKY53_10430 [Flavobacteriales bacterium]|nr:hypothetical protein [Flavobacteriales bacterium]